MRVVIAPRRKRTVRTPIAKIAAVKRRYAWRGTIIVVQSFRFARTTAPAITTRRIKETASNG